MRRNIFALSQTQIGLFVGNLMTFELIYMKLVVSGLAHGGPTAIGGNCYDIYLCAPWDPRRNERHIELQSLIKHEEALFPRRRSGL